MALPSKNFSQFLQDMSAVVQGSAATALDLTVGSVLRAILEANASLALWMQWLILQALQLTRAATSAGSDLDSWMADFSVARLPAVASQGVVTFSRYAAGVPAFIPVSTVLKTTDGSRAFTLATDIGMPTWSPDLNGYSVPAGVATIDLPAVAASPGIGGNVQAGSITMIASPLASIDHVGNANAFSGASDPETDDNLRRRFQNFINSRSRATSSAIAYAIDSVRPGLQYVIDENTDAAGAATPGRFLVTIDDGTGAPSSGLIASAVAAIEEVRPVGSLFAVQPPKVLPTDVSLTAVLDPLAQAPMIRASIAASIEAYVNGLAIGQCLSSTRLAEAVYKAVPEVRIIGHVLISNIGQDLVVGRRDVIKTRNVVVN
jgi:uncharacterized phage protein gp47/JayE